VQFREAALASPEITDTLSRAQIESALSLERSLKNADRVFERTGILKEVHAVAG
jgi:hypothetical protein